MNAEAVSTEILTIRERLAEIKRDRDLLPADAFSERADLKDEEHELRARLVKLQDDSLKDRDTKELHGVPGFPPT
ncbi:MAG TPA: hypothetical protein VJ948_13140 [Acidimicrobiia bacterium]|nr:hypothetical protein [Acidimicrobiia bacterium]